MGPPVGGLPQGNSKDSPSNVTTVLESQNPNAGAAGGPGGAAGGPGGASTGPGGKKHDPKEIMKKRRERAICIDRVSRVIFPSTFILLNIIYWLVFSEILDAIKYNFVTDEDTHH